MPIEFICPTCQQQLRVPDDAVGKNARCPKCNASAIVPAALEYPVGAGGPAPPAGAPFGGPNPWSFGDAQASAATPLGSKSTGANPYASPQPLPFQPAVTVAGGEIRNQRVGVDPIFNYAWQLWQQHLGLLVGIAATMLGVEIVFSIIGTLGRDVVGADAPEVGGLIEMGSDLVSNVIGLFLGIGNAQIALKLARGQRAEYAELFNGGSRFWPVLGASILAGIGLVLGLLLLIVPGIILMLVFWPFYYVLVDNKAGVIDSFSLAAKISEGNKGTTFLLWLLSVVIGIVGFLALCVGILFALPLITMIWAVAYLMMSGQLAAYGPGQMQPTPQPWPAKP
jgi:hypothetical protein